MDKHTEAVVETLRKGCTEAYHANPERLVSVRAADVLTLIAVIDNAAKPGEPEPEAKPEDPPAEAPPA